MKELNINKISLCCIFSVFILICISTIVLAEDSQSNVTQQHNITIQQPTPVKQEKFRVGPTVRIRPLNDNINKSADGIIEMYLENPSINDVSLTADVRIGVPSGIHVYGQGFGLADAAGMVYGKFDIPPGSVRTIYINIKAEKTGDFFAQFSGLYWPGDNKGAYQPISLTYPFTVYQPSPEPENKKLTNPEQILKSATGSGLTNNILAIIIIGVGVGFIYLVYRIYRKK